MRIERHQYRERSTTTLVDGETSRARAHHAIVKDGVVVSDLLPSGSLEHKSQDELEAQIRSKPSLVGGNVVFIAHEQTYTKRNRRGNLKTYIHGVNDGLSNVVKNGGVNPPEGHWLEAGDAYKPGRRRHDWQEAPYRG